MTPKTVEMRGIEPRAFHMQSERSTTELHPLLTAGRSKSTKSTLLAVGNIPQSRATASLEAKFSSPKWLMFTLYI